MTPIVVCTVGSPCLDVMAMSVEKYTNAPFSITFGKLGNFGSDYNEAMRQMFEIHDEIIIANDDIVLTPKSYEMLMDDVRLLKTMVDKLGFVAAMSDRVRGNQLLQQNESDWHIKETKVISPLFAWISKEAFNDAQFPPINWFSDDVMCKDLTALGYRHFISRAYVHHVGSQSIGLDVTKHLEQAKPWIQENRPEYYKEWYE